MDPNASTSQWPPRSTKILFSQLFELTVNPMTTGDEEYVPEVEVVETIMGNPMIDPKRKRYPFCIVWTPIPVLTWIFPFLGHMGIALSSGVIRDFAGSYYVSEDNMAFGQPTKYWILNPTKVKGGAFKWDSGVTEASHEYRKHQHQLCTDNCHSHVALALNFMKYNQSGSWNMVKLCFYMLLFSRYVSCAAFVKTWAPFCVLCTIITLLSVLL